MKKNIFISLILFFSLTASYATTRLDIVNASAKNIDQMMTILLQQQQKPYRAGAIGDDAFGTSGIAVFAYKSLGITLPNDPSQLSELGSKIKKSKNLKEGDIVFFHSKDKKNDIEYVGIVQHVKEDGSFNFIYVSNEKGVMIGHSEDPVFTNCFIKGCRIINGNSLENARKSHQKDLDAINEAILYETAAKNNLENAKQKVIEAENETRALKAKMDANNNIEISF